MQIVQNEGERSPTSLVWGTADSRGKNFRSCRSEAAYVGPELRETKHVQRVWWLWEVVCVCVWERERERERRRRGHRDLISEWMMTGFWGLSLAPPPLENIACLPTTLGLAVWVTATEMLQNGKNCTRNAMWLCAWPSTRERESYVV